jgi:hypothetical protein
MFQNRCASRTAKRDRGKKKRKEKKKKRKTLTCSCAGVFSFLVYLRFTRSVDIANDDDDDDDDEDAPPLSRRAAAAAALEPLPARGGTIRPPGRTEFNLLLAFTAACRIK